MADPKHAFARCGPGARTFARDLFEEHLDEAAYLYERWQYNYENPSCPWDELVEVGNRLDRHVAALLGGCEITLELCRERTEDADAGDPGHVHAAARVFCLLDRFDLLCGLGATLTAQDDARVQALEDALVRDAPTSWEARLGTLLSTAGETNRGGDEQPSRLGAPDSAPNSMFARAIVLCIGRRSMPLGPAVQKAARGEVADPVAYLWTLGRLKEPSASAILLRYAKGDDTRAKQAAFVSAIRLGILQAVAHLRQAARQEPWPALPLAVSGIPEALPLLHGMLERGQITRDVFLALGLFGAPESAGALLRGLEGPLSEAAAAGLYLLSGAEVTEDVVIRGESRERERGPQDDPMGEKGGKGEGKGEGEGEGEEEDEPVVMELRRLSRAPEAWRAWWANNAKRFSHAGRYRFGRPRAAPEPEAALLPRLRWLSRDLRLLVADDSSQPPPALEPNRERRRG